MHALINYVLFKQYKLSKVKCVLRRSVQWRAPLHRSMQSSLEAAGPAVSQLSETELRNIVDIVPVFLARYRPDGAVDFVNRTWRDYNGLSVACSEAAGREVTHPDDWAQ